MSRGKARDINDKLQAALAYSLTGSAEKAAKVCGIPERTIRDWTAMEWWIDLMHEAKARNQDELDAQWTGLIHKCVEEVAERLEKGDEFIDKNGEKYRKKVGAREAALVAAIAYDKRALMRGEATRRTENISTERKLDQIKQEFGKLGQKGLVADVEEADNPELMH